MNKYAPSSELTKAVLAAILAPVPYWAGLAIKAIPASIKEGGISMALAQVIPLSLGSIALTQSKDSRTVLTKHGELTEEVKRGLVRRIASWFVPNEVREVTAALQGDIHNLAQAGYATDSFRLEIESGEVVLVVLNTSRIRQSADTVVDLFFASSEKLAAVKDIVMRYVPKR